MSHHKLDPRVRKTRRNMREAFLRLIVEKGYDSISIQDIANEAETARITFYRHYHNKEDLLSDCLNTLYEGFVEKIEKDISLKTAQITAPIRIFYEHLEAKEELYRVLFSSLGIQTVVKRLTHYMSERMVSQLDFLHLEPGPGVPLDVIANHIASAQIGLGIWWLEQNRPYPTEQMIKISMELSLNGVIGVLGKTKVPGKIKVSD